jgi:hypothetical protein
MHTTATSRTLAVLLAISGALVAGCGDDGALTKAEYEEKVRVTYAEVQEAFARTNVAVDELAGRVEDAQDALRDAADELEAVQPPADVETEHAEVVAGLRAYADDLVRLVNAAERGDERTVEDFNARVATNASVEQIAEAAERMKFKGYDLGTIAEE